MSVQTFYDELAPLYHLVYENWEAGVARQGAALAALIREHWGVGGWTTGSSSPSSWARAP